MENFKKLCESIFTLDPSIRYVRVLGKNGIHLEGGYRDGVKPYLTDNELFELESYWRLIWDTKDFHKPRLGSIKSVTIEFDKIWKFTFTLDDEKFLVVSTELETIPNIKDKIQEIIKTTLKA